MLCAWYFIFGLGDRERPACYTSEQKEVEILDILRLLLTQKDQVLYIEPGLGVQVQLSKACSSWFDSHFTKIGSQLYVSLCSD